MPSFCPLAHGEQTFGGARPRSPAFECGLALLGERAQCLDPVLAAQRLVVEHALELQAEIQQAMVVRSTLEPALGIHALSGAARPEPVYRIVRRSGNGVDQLRLIHGLRSKRHKGQIAEYNDYDKTFHRFLLLALLRTPLYAQKT